MTVDFGIEVRGIAEPPQHDAVVCVAKGPVGAHVGVWYDDLSGGRRALHQAWHCLFRDQAATDRHRFTAWVVPSFDEDEAHDLGTAARKVALSRGAGRVPYGFARRNAHFRDDGSLDLADSSGLNCSALVMMVFELASVPLLAEGTWLTERSADRESEDRAAQRTLLNELPFDQQEKLENELGAPRVRAEEVAAASGMSGRPVRFADCAPVGAALLEQLVG